MTATATVLPCAMLMPLHDLLTAHAAYEKSIRDHLNGRGPGLSRREREHAHEVGEQVAEWRAAVRWSGRRAS